MKKIILSVLLFTAVNLTAQISIDGGVKGSYNSTWLFNKNISDQGAEQDYDMAWGSNVGIGAAVYYGPIGFGVEFLRGTHTGGYAGDFGLAGFLASGKYTSNVKLNVTQIPLLLKLKSKGGAYIELGAQVNSISKAIYNRDFADNDLFDATDNTVTSEYAKSFTSAVLGFGANVRFVKAIPLSLNVGLRLQYGLTDAKGVDAMGVSLENTVFYPTRQNTNAASGGIMIGLNYTFEAK
ncbi:MAG: PorT family protein [Crocinitomicaceae bacterium]|nr:PorT family protein [Crocinitomicaceae bacterium]MCF8411376.1 PorT family protein [Crocinitomicaceae bacterium]MCF8444497.1 PorT family protein [Crocinitomicaceae bacterium]